MAAGRYFPGPRAGMAYRMGLDHNGQVVHIYDDGQHIVLHKPGQPVEYISPHPADQQIHQAENAAALQAAQYEHPVQPSPEHAPSSQQIHQAENAAALQAAAAHFAALSGQA